MPQHIVDDDEFDLDVETLDDDDAALDDAMPGTPPAESEADEGTTPKSAAPQSEAEKPETDGEDDAIESYSKRVQKRINKLTTKMRQYESETAYWKERVAALEAKTNAREIADFQSQVDRTTADLERQIENARAAKKAAIEEGDIDRQIKTDDQILELREQLAEKRRIANAAKEQADKLRDEPKQPPAAPTSPISSDLPAGTQRWLRANPWFMKGEHPRAADVARALDAALQEEGYSPDDPAMYAELDRRLAVVAPQTVKERLKSAPPRPKVAGSSADGQRGADPASPNVASKPARKLTQDDLSKMRRYGFDPTKAEDRKSWLKRNDPL